MIHCPEKNGWEGNKDVTSQETCLFLYNKNFRDLKFIDLTDTGDSHLCFAVVLICFISL